MRNFYICIILITLHFCISTRGLAQSWHMQESSSTLKGPKLEILPQPNGDILTITHPKPGTKGPMIVSRFDPELNEIYSRKISLLSHERYQAAWYAGDQLFLFSTDKLGGLTRYEIDENTGNLTGQPLPIAGLLGIADDSREAAFFVGQSVNGEFHYIISAVGKRKPADRRMHGIILNRRGEKTGSFDYTLAAKAHAADPDLYFVQANDGSLSLIYSTPAYTVAHIDIDGSVRTFPLSGLPEGNFQYVSWESAGTNLRFSGLLGRSHITNFTAIVTGNVDLHTGTVFDVRQTEVAMLMAQAGPATRRRLQEGFPAQLHLLPAIPLTDGSRIMLFESSGEHIYQNHFSPASQNPATAFGRSGVFTPISSSAQGIRYQSRGDVYVLKLDANNRPQWLNVLSKDQEESEQVTSIGIGCLADPQDNLHIFFYDNRHNTEACSANPTLVRTGDPREYEFACISITPDGAMTKQFLPAADPRYELMPELTFVDNRNKACFLAVKTKMSIPEQLGTETAGYKLGTIAIK